MRAHVPAVTALALRADWGPKARAAPASVRIFSTSTRATTGARVPAVTALALRAGWGAQSERRASLRADRSALRLRPRKEIDIARRSSVFAAPPRRPYVYEDQVVPPTRQTR